MPSFAVPLSGLDVNSAALAAISNNLANLNTVAFKTSETEFRDLFYQTLGTSADGSPLQLGAGSAVSATSTNFNQGSVEADGVKSNVAIQGDGFFVVDKDGVREYTRAGNFLVNATGELVTPEGAKVLGFPATGGVVSQNTTPAPIKIHIGDYLPPQPSKSLSMRLNLDASAPTGATYSTECAVYDSLGVQHSLTFQFTKSGSGSWDYAVNAEASDFVNTSAGLNPLTSGKLTFDANGQMQTSTPVAIPLTGLADGAGPQTIQWTLSGGGITQQASPSTVLQTDQDGYPGGQLTDYSIASDGRVQGTSSTGQTVTLGQLCLATFSNLVGLQRSGDNSYTSTLESGAASIGVPGVRGAGTLTGGALELSNVDIAREFSKLIIAQRGFQASAKAITTFDEIAQDTINIKR